MAITDEQRQKLIEEFRLHEGDSGSADVQIAILSADIKELTEHMKVHKKDYHSRRGLLQKVGRRSKLLKYLARQSPERCLAISERFGIRR
jgi:small subunit ribosomal protein S15